MIEWVDSKKLKVTFGSEPFIAIRYILPSMTNDEKQSIKKYPFINKVALKICLNDKKKNVIYNFIIPKGYCFDGASVPRFFWRIIGANTDNKFLVASMIHDYMCENHDCINYDRAFSTAVFNELLKVSEVGNIKRFLMKNSVDIFQRCFCNWRA